MKRYSMTQVFMGLGCAMVATHDGNYVLHSEAQAEIDALKAQNAELLAALTESLAYVEATLSNHDACCQRHPSTEHARDCILSDLNQIKTAIAKARGESV